MTFPDHDMRNHAAILVDVGSTVIKLCHSPAPGQFGAVERVRRQHGVPPGEQVRELVAASRARAADAALRVCSSANGGVRVGVLGLSRRHSVAAAARAAVVGGGNVVYARTFGDPGEAPSAPVDVLVVTGGVDGGDHRHLRRAVAAVNLAGFPHAVLIWAGAADAVDVAERLKPGHLVSNVLDGNIRPRGDGLIAAIRGIYLTDLTDHKGLRALAGCTEAPVWPTPAVVSLAAQRMARERLAALVPAPATPFVVVDVGGATTDIHYCAELRRGNGAHPTPAESVTRHVFADLGVSSSSRSLLARLSSAPYLHELAEAVAPSRVRALYQQIREEDPAALAPPAGFLACLFASLRELADGGGSAGLELSKAASVLVTGGAWGDTPGPLIRQVIDAAYRTRGSRWRLVVDRSYLFWAYGLEAVPG